MHQIKRVICIDVPEPFTFPLKDRKEMVRRGEITGAAEEEVEVTLEVQDAVEGVAPNPKAETLSSYVAKKSKVRSRECFGCMRPSCNSFRGPPAVESLEEALDSYSLN